MDRAFSFPFYGSELNGFEKARGEGGSLKRFKALSLMYRSVLPVIDIFIIKSAWAEKALGRWECIVLKQ